MKRPLEVLLHRQAVLFGTMLLLPVIALAPFPNDKAVSLSQMVQADGTLHLPVAPRHTCTGWRIMLDPALRAHFVRTETRTPACPERRRVVADADGYWDNELVLPGVTGRIRAGVVRAETVYVTVRFDFEQPRQTVYGLLRWEAGTGRWHVVGTPPDGPPPARRDR